MEIDDFFRGLGLTKLCGLCGREALVFCLDRLGICPDCWARMERRSRRIAEILAEKAVR